MMREAPSLSSRMLVAIAAWRAPVVAFVSVLGVAGCTSGSDQASPPAQAASGPSALSVNLVRPRSEQWPRQLKSTGQIVAWQEVVISPETGGLRLKELKVDIGAKVRRGQVLALLADDSLRVDHRKQEAAVLQARISLEQATSDLRRSRLAEGSGALSAQKIEEYRLTAASAEASLESARAELQSIELKLAQTRVLAPDDGIVSSKSGVLGSVVSAGAELFRLVRQGRVEWRPEIDSGQLALLSPNQTARITLPSGQTVTGRLRVVGPTMSSSTGRATLYVELPPDSLARAGMFATGVLLAGTQPATTLPLSALVMRDGRSYVYTVDSGGQAHAIAVATGRREGDRIEVVSGMDSAAQVVASGGAFLSEGSKVTVLAGPAVAASGAAR
ncbi:hypothetical protein CKO44_13540 [Rubrivivax gelatinosus]|nr:hypothetical protein [Rubrivivax gelatinosus]MBZ8143106.1 efflux transporter periplasmic adaptor subunit [Rubrivivax gelatinosus]